MLNFVGVQTGFSSPDRRDALRTTGFPSDPYALLRNHDGAFVLVKIYRNLSLKVRMSWNVGIAAENLDSQGLLLQRAILICLLQDFTTKKATKDLGNLLPVTTVNNIGKGKASPQSGDVFFPVDFTCLTFRFFRTRDSQRACHQDPQAWRVLELWSYGPIETVFLSTKKMPSYELVPGDENQMSVSKKRAKLETRVRFSVMDSKWVESERSFMALGSLDGDHLGAI